MKIDWEKISDYLNGNLSDEGKKQFENWLDQNAGNRVEFERISKIWNAASAELPKPETEEALKKVLARIKTAERETPVFSIGTSDKQTTPFNNFLRSNFVRTAAAIIIFVGAAFLISKLLTKNSEITVSVANEEIQSIVLDDGTKVTLDAGSIFTYPNEITNSKTRDVSLIGNAFFEVARNEHSPFTVHAKNGLVTVLGTKFNVSAWNNKNGVTVAVSEGKVSLKLDIKNSLNEVLITNGQMSSLKSDGTLSEPVDVDIANYISWINREIYFHNELFGTVIDQIERWYDVNIELKDTTLLNNRITVFIENKPLKENLKVIAALMNLKYQINKNVIVFSSLN